MKIKQTTDKIKIKYGKGSWYKKDFHSMFKSAYYTIYIYSIARTIP